MNTGRGWPAIAVRATSSFKRQTAIGLAVPFLVPALLLILSHTATRAHYQTGYRIGACVAFTLALYIAVSFSAPLWRPFFAFTDAGLLVSARHLVPWSAVKSATVVTVEKEPIFGFRLQARALAELPAGSKRAVTRGAYWPRVHLVGAAPANGITPNITELREALSLYGVSFDDRAHRVDAQ